METNLVIESLKFMVLGMGIVYILLSLIVFLTTIQAKLVAKYFPDKPSGGAVGAKSSTGASSDDGAVVAAIVAAVTKYKKG